MSAGNRLSTGTHPQRVNHSQNHPHPTHSRPAADDASAQVVNPTHHKIARNQPPSTIPRPRALQRGTVTYQGHRLQLGPCRERQVAGAHGPRQRVGHLRRASTLADELRARVRACAQAPHELALHGARRVVGVIAQLARALRGCAGGGPVGRVCGT